MTEVLTLTSSEMDRDAVISECGRYRYCLTRIWDSSLPGLGFIMLNPSTADASIDDRTILKCIHFAKRYGFGAVAVCNMFAFRSTDPKALKDVTDPVGPENHAYLFEMATGKGPQSKIVAAWGVNDVGLAGEAIIRLFPELWCLGTTKDGHPKHPLYLPNETEIIPFSRGGNRL